jgi:hypothetical protein
MTYVLFVYDRPDSLATFSDEEKNAVYREYEALGGIPHLAGHRLQAPDSATTVRVRDGARELLPGPLHQDGELLIGFYLLETDNRDEAIAIAARIPAARLGGAVELRPLAGE